MPFFVARGSWGRETSPNYGRLGSLPCLCPGWSRLRRYLDAYAKFFTSGCWWRFPSVCDRNTGCHSHADTRTGDSRSGRGHTGTTSTSREHLWGPQQSLGL